MASTLKGMEGAPLDGFEATLRTLQGGDDDGIVDRANDLTVLQLQALQWHLSKHSVENLHELEKRGRRVASHLTVMSWAAFVVGLGLLVVAVYGSLATDMGTGTALGLGGLGVVEMLGVALYRPMDRMQEAQTDLSQQSVILRTWTLTTSLYLRAMDVGDEASVEDAALKIREAADEFANSLETLVEG